MEGIRQLGKLFDFDATESYEYVEFNRILEEIDGNFNVTDKVTKVRTSVCDFFHCKKSTTIEFKNRHLAVFN